MKWGEIENRLGDYVNSEKDAHTDEDIDFFLSTEVWSGVENQIKPVKWLPILLKSAAVILFFLGCGALFFQSLNQKNNKIAQLENEIKGLKNSKYNLLAQVEHIQVQLNEAKQLVPDFKTVYKTKTIYKTIEIKQESQGKLESTSMVHDSIPSTSMNEGSILAMETTGENHIENGNDQQGQTKEKQIVYHFDFGPVVPAGSDAKRTWKMTMSAQ